MELTQEQYDQIFSGIESEYITKYIDDIVSEALSGVFDLKKCPKGRYWYGEWVNHRRMVVNVYSSKGVLYPLRWGYNYDYIPWLNNQDKFVYRRTEKSVGCDVDDSFYEYVHYDSKNMSNIETMHIREKYCLPIYAKDIELAKKYMGTIVKRNIPFMLDWYERTKTDEAVLAELDEKIAFYSHAPYITRNYYWTKAFILAHYNKLDQAIEAMEKYYDGYTIPEKVLDKLKAVRMK